MPRHNVDVRAATAVQDDTSNIKCHHGCDCCLLPHEPPQHAARTHTVKQWCTGQEVPPTERQVALLAEGSTARDQISVRFPLHTHTRVAGLIDSAHASAAQLVNVLLPLRRHTSAVAVTTVGAVTEVCSGLALVGARRVGAGAGSGKVLRRDRRGRASAASGLHVLRVVRRLAVLAGPGGRGAARAGRGRRWRRAGLRVRPVVTNEQRNPRHTVPRA